MPIFKVKWQITGEYEVTDLEDLQDPESVEEATEIIKDDPWVGV